MELSGRERTIQAHSEQPISPKGVHEGKANVSLRPLWYLLPIQTQVSLMDRSDVGSLHVWLRVQSRAFTETQLSQLKTKSTTEEEEEEEEEDDKTSKWETIKDGLGQKLYLVLRVESSFHKPRCIIRCQVLPRLAFDFDFSVESNSGGCQQREQIQITEEVIHGFQEGNMTLSVLSSSSINTTTLEAISTESTSSEADVTQKQEQRQALDLESEVERRLEEQAKAQAQEAAEDRKKLMSKIQNLEQALVEAQKPQSSRACIIS